jgi:hypothetical protein
MATRTAAEILKWEKVIGSLECGKRADLLVIEGASGDPYESLIHANETAIQLVMVNGVARYGEPALMGALGLAGEPTRVGGKPRELFFEQETSDPDVRKVSLRSACEALTEALRDIRKLAKELEKPTPAGRKALRALDRPEPIVWTLALDEIRETGVELRPRLPFSGPRDFTGPSRLAPRAAASARATPLSQLLDPIALDPLTVADDSDFLGRVAAQPNLPAGIGAALGNLY